MKKLVLLGFCAFGLAQADVIPMLMGSGGVNCGIQGGTWGCDYSYTAQLHGESQLTATQSDHEEYFTLYDFNGYIADSAIVPGVGLWLVSTSNVGLTPSDIRGENFDDASVVNVTFTYVGNSDVAAGSDLGTFTLRSQFGPAVRAGRFASQATYAGVLSPNSPTWVQNTGHVDVPVPFRSDVEPIPEPMTMALIGSGLAGLGLFRRVRS